MRGFFDALVRWWSVCWSWINRSDFNRGFTAGAACIIAVIVLYLVIRLLIWLLFRAGSVSVITVERSEGSLTICRDALADFIIAKLSTYPAVEIRKIKIYHPGRHYDLLLFGSFDTKQGNLGEVSSEINKFLGDAVRLELGVSALRRISFRFEKLAAGHQEAEYSIPAPAVNPSSNSLL